MALPLPKASPADAPNKQLAAVLKAVGIKQKAVVRRFTGTIDIPTSILAYGRSRCGKSHALAQLLECRPDGNLAKGKDDGMKIACINTDMGGESATLETIQNHLRAVDKSELMENFISIPTTNYDETIGFINDPVASFPEIWDIGLDMVAWDGFTAYQLNQLDESVLTEENRGGTDDKTGLFAGQQDWGKIYRGTRRPLQKFISLYNEKTKEGLHKFMTCLESEKSGDYGTASTSAVRSERGPLLDGKAKALIGPAFSVVLALRKVSENGETVYKYLTQGDDTMLAGSRGHNLLPVESANMCDVWRKIRTGS